MFNEYNKSDYDIFRFDDGLTMVSNPHTLLKGIQMLSQRENTKKSEEGGYYCFSISDLYKDLFIGKKETVEPLVKGSNFPKNHRGILAFLLPSDMFEEIDQNDNIKEEKHNDNYAGFFQFSVNDNKLRDLLFKMMSDRGWDSFIDSIRAHIIGELDKMDDDFSKNAVLKQYLDDVGNKKIVPYHDDVGNKKIIPSEQSRDANEKFKALLKKSDRASISLIIANFFISCLIGLRSMNYSKKTTPEKGENQTKEKNSNKPPKKEGEDQTKEKKKKNPSKKTYLLSEFGMECIWRPDLITPPRERLDEARQAYKCGNYISACNLVEQWLDEFKEESSSEELSIAYKIFGLSLYNLTSSDNKKYRNRQAEGIEYLEKSVKKGNNDPFVYYFLYDYFKDDDDRKQKTENYLKTAFEQNYAKAVIEVASLFLKKEKIFADVTEAEILEKINYIIEKEAENAPIDVGNCYYIKGEFFKNKEADEAKKCFEAAAERGNEKARQEIGRQQRKERHFFPTFVDSHLVPCCFANTLTGKNKTVLSTFPNQEWSLYTCDKAAENDLGVVNTVGNIDEFIKENIEEFKSRRSKTVFLFMSENEEKNLNDCLILLDKLFNLTFDMSENQKWQIIDSIDIYVGAKYETASMMIDANVSDMGKNIYFKVHIMDENRDTVHKLLCEAPLFLPALNRVQKEDFTKVVLFGDSEMNYTFIKESIACAYLGKKHPIDIVLLGDNADALENRFRRECPGIYNDDPHISCIRPQFIKCKIKEADFPSFIYGKIHDRVSNSKEKSLDADIVNALSEGNYFVVDYTDDLENIRFAAELRTWLLRSRGTFDRAPFIAVKCSNEQNSYLVKHLTLVGRDSGNSYYNKYDLFPIGISAQVYSYNNLIENPELDKYALESHKSYYGSDERAAENDYYSYSYNADSSLLTVIGWCYRFFVADIKFDDKEKYIDCGFMELARIEPNFDKKYKANREDLARLEHSRWNGFMLSRGWESADSIQVRAYKEQSTGNQHKHVLAKMHPTIREWDELKKSDFEKSLGILKSKFNYNRNPQETTKKNIDDTAEYFERMRDERERER